MCILCYLKFIFGCEILNREILIRYVSKQLQKPVETPCCLLICPSDYNPARFTIFDACHANEKHMQLSDHLHQFFHCQFNNQQPYPIVLGTMLPMYKFELLNCTVTVLLGQDACSDHLHQFLHCQFNSHIAEFRPPGCLCTSLNF